MESDRVFIDVAPAQIEHFAAAAVGEGQRADRRDGLGPAGFVCIGRVLDPAGRGRIVAVRADGPGNATRVRLMSVESGRSVLRATNPDLLDIAVDPAPTRQ